MAQKSSCRGVCKCRADYETAAVVQLCPATCASPAWRLYLFLWCGQSLHAHTRTHAHTHTQVNVGEDEPEDIAVRKFMKKVMESGVIEEVRGGRRGCVVLLVAWPSPQGHHPDKLNVVAMFSPGCCGP